ncbi:SDR family NAD(P)-dependent oxidoreductase [Gammaproteobacteria bacterium]|nr:SDR family NAD(P)-dependent oxidoreductase [Gammaproteobacteria bacterium]
MHSSDLKSFLTECDVAIIGASGGIGKALTKLISQQACVRHVYSCSRTNHTNELDKTSFIRLNITDESSVISAVEKIKAKTTKLDLVIVATGTLHEGKYLQPEKSWRSLNADNLQTIFQINTIGPTLVAKHFLDLLPKDRKSVFAALSARVGSIKDNSIGGWYAYRSSKAALNMMVKTLSIELSRKNPNAIAVTLHPGTVDTKLSQPFQGSVPRGNLFSPQTSAEHLLKVIDNLQPESTGHLFAWDGKLIPF